MFRIIAVYPRKDATRIALFNDREEVRRQEIRHDRGELEKISRAPEQWSHRMRAVTSLLSEWGVGSETHVDAVIGPAAIRGKLPAGVYDVDNILLGMIKEKETDHYIDLGATLADSIARVRGARPFAVIALSGDEFDPVSKLSGIPELSFGKVFHSLHIKDAIYRASDDIEIPIGQISLVVAYLGKSFSICSYSDGRVRDLSNSHERGPFSPSRSGSLPAAELVRMAYSGMWSRDDLYEKICVKGGMTSYMGTDNLLDVAKLMAMGDTKAGLVYRAMAYRIASEIASQTATLKGDVDAIVLTGGCVNDEIFTEIIKDWISWIKAPVLAYKREDELKSMAKAALRVLEGREEAISIGKELG